MFYVLNEYENNEVLVYDDIEKVPEIVKRDDVLSLSKIEKIVGIDNGKFYNWVERLFVKFKLLGKNIVNSKEYDIINYAGVIDDYLVCSRYIDYILIKAYIRNKGQSCKRLSFKYLKFDEVHNLEGLLQNELFSDTSCVYDLVNLDTRGCIDMNSMFRRTRTPVIKLGHNFDTRSVKNTNYMFSSVRGADVLDLSGLDMRNVMYADNMFSSARIRNLILGNKFTLDNTCLARSMFVDSTIHIIDLTSVKGNKITDFSNMFMNCDAERIIFGKDFRLESAKYIFSMFQSTQNLRELDLSMIEGKNIFKADKVFYQSGVKTIKFGKNFTLEDAYDVNGMFGKTVNLKELDLSYFNLENAGKCSGMFKESWVRRIKFGSKLGLNKVTSAYGMFEGTSFLREVDLSMTQFRNVVNYSRMFSHSGVERVNLSNLKFMSDHILFDSVFNECKNLEILDLSNIDAGNLSSGKFENVFYGCDKLKKIIINRQAYEKIKSIVNKVARDDEDRCYCYGLYVERLKDIIEVID